MKKILFLMLFIPLTACVSTKQADQRILAWNNNITLQELINAWGIPSKSRTIAERKYYIWNAQGSSSSTSVGISMGSYGGHGGISLGTILGGDVEQHICSRVAEVDAEENVVSVQWTGDAKLCYDLTPERLNTATTN